MNWVDLVVLAVVLVSGLVGVLRGMVREVLGVAAWVAAAWIASPYGVFPYVAPWARKQGSDPGVGDILAFGGVFLSALIVLWIVVGTWIVVMIPAVYFMLEFTIRKTFGDAS